MRLNTAKRASFDEGSLDQYLREISQYPLITREEEVSLAQRIRTGEEEALDKLRAVKRQVASAIKKTHSVRVADLVLVSPGSIPITTSGKVRRSACVERYRLDEFSRLDVGT